MLGAYKDAQEPDTEVKDFAKTFKGTVEGKVGKTYDKFDAVKYTTQVVAGTNYKFKYDVGDGSYVHVKVYQPLPHTNEPAEVKEVQEGKTLDDAL